ncbi:MAG: hypothetical protein IT405_00275 [Candidatus Yanofskybacteria bacterium]|nr:hypothetical protein [Candidatus Yanofskybacteria bacterium]
MQPPRALKRLLLPLASLSPVLALAQSVPVPIEGETLTLRKIVLLVQDVIDTLFILVSIVIVGVMVYAGFKMATAGGDSKKFDEGKTRLKQAVWGAIVVFGVGIIINTIADFATSPTQILR